jgi:replication factor A1
MTKPLQCIVKETIIFIQSNSFCYLSFPIIIEGKQCKKRAQKYDDGKWYCSKCEATFEDCNYRYVLQVKLQDQLGNLWEISFEEETTKLIGMPTKELYMLQFNEDASINSEEVIQNVLFKKFLFTLTSINEIYNNDSQLKATILEDDTTDFTNERNFLLNQIANLCSVQLSIVV